MRGLLGASSRCCLRVALALGVAGSGCSRPDEPTAIPKARSSAAASSVPTSSASANDPAEARRATDKAFAKASPAPGDSARPPPLTAPKNPEWDLDALDPARDYVAHYLRATKRYGAKPCVVVQPSTFADGVSTVETHNDPSGDCGTAGELRDRFRVTVSTDTMSLDPTLHAAKLARWPDGSDPEGPPSKVMDIQDLRHWKTKLHETFTKLELVPLRVQLYGRGTYTVVSIAGWHGPILRTLTPGQLEAPARAFCDANEGEGLGIFAGVDRATLLRVSCPGSARFETL